MPARVLQQRAQKRPRGRVECEVMREESRRLVGVARVLAACAQMRDDALDCGVCADELAIASPRDGIHVRVDLAQTRRGYRLPSRTEAREAGESGGCEMRQEIVGDPVPRGNEHGDEPLAERAREPIAALRELVEPDVKFPL